MYVCLMSVPSGVYQVARTKVVTPLTPAVCGDENGTGGTEKGGGGGWIQAEGGD